MGDKSEADNILNTYGLSKTNNNQDTKLSASELDMTKNTKKKAKIYKSNLF